LPRPTGLACGRSRPLAWCSRPRNRATLPAKPLVVEQIRSGALEAPADYEEEQDEWVVLLAGRAVLVVDGEPVELTPGDWLFLPAGLRHRLVETEPGTSWLAVY
jgi:cupin 2 domain-containing protein